MIKLAWGWSNIELRRLAMTMPARGGGRVTPSGRGTLHLTVPIELLIGLEHRIIVRVEAGYVRVGIVPIAVEVRVTAVTTSTGMNGIRPHGIVQDSPGGMTSHLVWGDRKTAIHGRRNPLGGLDGVHGSHGHGRSGTRDRVTERWCAHRGPALT